MINYFNGNGKDGMTYKKKKKSNFFEPPYMLKSDEIGIYEFVLESMPSELAHCKTLKRVKSKRLYPVDVLNTDTGEYESEKIYKKLRHAKKAYKKLIEVYNER